MTWNGETAIRARDTRFPCGLISLYATGPVRVRYADKPEMIAAHSAPLTVHVDGTQFHAAADSLSILQQVEGALAYLETLAMRAETAAYQRMRLALTGIRRDMHNRMHQLGQFHEHAAGGEQSGRA